MRLRRLRDEEGNEDRAENMIRGATLGEDWAKETGVKRLAGVMRDGNDTPLSRHATHDSITNETTREKETDDTTTL